MMLVDHISSLTDRLEHSLSDESNLRIPATLKTDGSLGSRENEEDGLGQGEAGRVRVADF